MNIFRHFPNLKYICRNLSLPGCMKAYFVTALHHEVFDGVFKWLLSEVGREEAGVSLGNSSSNTAIQRNSLFCTDVMSHMHNIFRDSKFWSNISKTFK